MTVIFPFLNSVDGNTTVSELLFIDSNINSLIIVYTSQTLYTNIKSNLTVCNSADNRNEKP